MLYINTRKSKYSLLEYNYQLSALSMVAVYQFLVLDDFKDGFVLREGESLLVLILMLIMTFISFYSSLQFYVPLALRFFK